jgi:preprotein translocase subunit SecF
MCEIHNAQACNKSIQQTIKRMMLQGVTLSAFLMNLFMIQALQGSFSVEGP